MTEDILRWCVLIPCSAHETWAVPQICLAEILTVHTDEETPPTEVEWRGRTLPVLDLGADDGSSWQGTRKGSALIAIFLGLEGEGFEYWGVAVRGETLSVEKVPHEDVKDAPEEAVAHATAAFHLKGALYQVPDLDALQKKLALEHEAA